MSPAPFPHNDQPTYSYKYPDIEYHAPKTEIISVHGLILFGIVFLVMVVTWASLTIYSNTQDQMDDLKKDLHEEIEFIKTASCDELRDALLYHRIYWYGQYATETYLGKECSP